MLSPVDFLKGTPLLFQEDLDVENSRRDNISIVQQERQNLINHLLNAKMIEDRLEKVIFYGNVVGLCITMIFYSGRNESQHGQVWQDS